MIYLVTFFISGISFLFSDYCNGKRYKKASVGFAITGILVLAFLAGMRSEEVGIDVTYYIIPRYNFAHNLSLAEYMNGISGEYLFYFILYYSSHIGSTPFFALFLIELMILLPIYFSWFLVKDECHFSSVMFLYMFLLYNFSLCVMRQFIACSLLLWSFMLLQKNRYVFSIIVSLLAIGFHSSAIIFIAFILCNKFINKAAFKLLFLIAFFVVLLNFENILAVMTQQQIIPSYYLERFIDRKEEAGINLIEVVGWSILYVIPLLIYQINKDSFVSKTTLLSYVGLMLLWSGLISSSMYRISLYFRYAVVLIYPIAMATVKKNKKYVYMDRSLYISLNLFVTLIVMFIWWYIIVSCNYFGTYPYHSFKQ